MKDFITILSCTISAGTPILFALLGDLIGQRSGTISINVEGCMLVGACAGYITACKTHSLLLSLLAGMLAGGLLALIHAFLSVTRGRDMMTSGFVLNFFATGLTTFFGRNYLGVSMNCSFTSDIPVLSEIPVIGETFFSQDPLTYLSYILPVAVWFFLTKTRPGLILCSVGEAPEVTEACGYNTKAIRYAGIIIAGVLAAIGGVQMSTVYTMSWANGMINGRGFIASAMVVMCAWKAERTYFPAYLFGLAQALQVYLQVKGANISMYITLMMPYLLTLVALAVISMNKRPSMPEKLKIIS